ITRPVWPALLPVTTFTVSSLWMFTPDMSQHLRGERDDLHEATFAELTRDGSEDACPARVLRVGRQDHHRVVVEPDVRAVLSASLLGGPNDDGLDDLTLLDPAAGQGVLDGADDHVTHVRVPTAAAAENADHEDLLGPGVVRHLAARFLLDHLLGPLHDLDDPPALALGGPPRLHQPNGVADVRVVRLVVRGELVRTRDGLLVQRVSHVPVDPDEHGLVHLVGHDDAHPDLAPGPVARRGLVRHGLFVWFAHDASASAPGASFRRSASRSVT